MHTYMLNIYVSFNFHTYQTHAHWVIMLSILPQWWELGLRIALGQITWVFASILLLCQLCNIDWYTDYVIRVRVRLVLRKCQSSKTLEKTQAIWLKYILNIYWELDQRNRYAFFEHSHGCPGDCLWNAKMLLKPQTNHDILSISFQYKIMFRT